MIAGKAPSVLVQCEEAIMNGSGRTRFLSIEASRFATATSPHCFGTCLDVHVCTPNADMCDSTAPPAPCQRRSVPQTDADATRSDRKTQPNATCVVRDTDVRLPRRVGLIGHPTGVPNNLLVTSVCRYKRA